MTLKTRLWGDHLRAASIAFAGAAAIAVQIAATQALAAPAALSQADAQHYAAAFAATDRGDFIEAQMQADGLQDRSLLGYLSFGALMHPTAHKAAFTELAGWLARFRDLPIAGRIEALAAKRQPAGPAGRTAKAAARPDRTQGAREAFYGGDPRRALQLATATGDRWIAGLSAYRLQSYDQAQGFLEALANDPAEEPWLRAAAGFWAARAATALGDVVAAAADLALAAQSPQTFYGMIAERRLQILDPHRVASGTGQVVRASFAPPQIDLTPFVSSDIRAHRAAALAQIGRSAEAGQELRAGLADAQTAAERQAWSALAASLGGAWPVGAEDYPTPLLEPQAGFTVDKALVYAIVRQESRFNPLAVSRAGAVGLMQLMPDAAASAAGDDKLKSDMSPLFEPAYNLRVGQDYLTWLMERGVGYDLLRVVASYNGGPGAVQKTVQMLGGAADSLLIIECLPAQETRNYVEKVMAGYWTYRRMWGQEVRTLDVLATGTGVVDARLDLADPRGPGTQLSAQARQVGFR